MNTNMNIILHWMVMLLVLTSPVQASQTDCPVSCMCLGEFVQCGNLSDHVTFPSETETILIERAHIKELHRGHFAGLKYLKVIEIRENSNISIIGSHVFSNLKHLDGIFISESNIGIIKENAFYNLSNFQTLNIHHSNITKIESKAFNKLSQISRIEVASNNIKSISTSAFHNITEIKSFELFLNEIKEFLSGAFQNVQCQRVQFYLNTIQKLPCNSIESLLTLSNDTNFYSNNFKCDCGINWMQGVQELQSHLSNNVCLNGTSLDKFYTSEAVAACRPSIGCGKSSAATTVVPHISTKPRATTVELHSSTKPRTTTVAPHSSTTPRTTTVVPHSSTKPRTTGLKVTMSVDDTTETDKFLGRSPSTTSMYFRGTSETTYRHLNVTKPSQHNPQKTTEESTRMPKVSRKFMPKVQDGGSSNSSGSLQLVCLYLLLLPFGILNFLS